MTKQNNDQKNSTTTIATNNIEETATVSESMKDYEDILNQSFRTIKEGDLLSGTILAISDEGITLDIQYFTDGFIPTEEISKDPNFSVSQNYQIGDVVSAIVLSEENENGDVVLSIIEADAILSWDKLKEAMETEKIYKAHITKTVPAGLITYIENIQGFIPISQISTEHIEDTSLFAGKQLDVIITEVDQAKSKLILSAKRVLQNKAVADKQEKISALQTGIITTGIVEKIVPYGAFVRLEDGLSGLVHISEICGRHLQSPKEVIHEGDTVTVKIIKITDGKISLSMKQADNNKEGEDVVEHLSDGPTEYSSGESASTSLASILAKL